MTNPARPDVDALAAIAGRCSNEADRETIIKAVNALRATPASGEAAEGVSHRFPDGGPYVPPMFPPKPAPDAIELGKAAANAGVIDTLEEIGALPPAPDAVREALKSLADWCSTERAKLGSVDGYDYHSGEEYGLRCAEIEITKRLAAPVPPADGAREPFAWVVLSDVTGNTRLWTRNGDIAKAFAAKHFLECIELYRSPSGTGAAEPVAWGRVIDGKAVTVSREQTPTNDEPLYAVPPIRGDRIDVSRFMEVVRSRWNFEETEFDAIENVVSDPNCVAALSLPVQPGAGEEKKS